MSFYLMRFGYTTEAWARLIKKPEDRREVARGIIEKLGGKLHGFWYGFGEHDGFVLIEAPSNVSAAAFAVGIAAGGDLPAPTVLNGSDEPGQFLAAVDGVHGGTSEHGEDRAGVPFAVGGERVEVASFSDQQAAADGNGGVGGQALAVEHEVDQGTAGAPVAVGERVDRLEMGVGDRCLGQDG